MRNIDLAGAVGRFLQAPQGQETRIRQGASRLIADLFESLDDERLGGLVKSSIANRIRKMEVSPLLGAALASAINEDRHVPMLEAAIRWTARALDANEGLIREMVHKRANWVLKLAGLDAKLADAIVDGLRKLTADMHTDPAHPVRIKIEQALADLANDLQTKPETRERVEAMKVELLDNKSVSLWLDALWQRAREAMIRSARNPDAALAGKLGEILQSMGHSLENDPRMKSAINMFARRAVAGMAASYGVSIVKLVSETVRRWDAQTITNRLEAAGGRDLQYIRINGRWSADWSALASTRWTRFDSRDPRSSEADARRLPRYIRPGHTVTADVRPGQEQFQSTGGLSLSRADEGRVIGLCGLHVMTASIATCRSGGSQSWRWPRSSRPGSWPCASC
jgi:uncharacterized membrane-anchored protein YjiN (DUF445 family)